MANWFENLFKNPDNSVKEAIETSTDKTEIPSRNSSKVVSIETGKISKMSDKDLVVRTKILRATIEIKKNELKGGVDDELTDAERELSEIE